MKIVVLAGSPYKKGTSNTLVNEFIRGAEEVGKQVEVIDLSHIDIHPCMVCDVLSKDIDEWLSKNGIK